MRCGEEVSRFGEIGCLKEEAEWVTAERQECRLDVFLGSLEVTTLATGGNQDQNSYLPTMIWSTGPTANDRGRRGVCPPIFGSMRVLDVS